MTRKPGRNDPCACGSGKKYKQCCLQIGASVAPGRSHETDSISEGFQAALEHHQAGHLPQAKSLYQQILQAVPNHPDALHFLGVIANQEGNNEAAVEFIGKAIRINPSSLMHYNLGLALKAQGNLDAAAESYRMALSIKPDYAEAHYNMGNIFQEQSRLNMAVACYRKAITCKPDYARAHCNLGNVLQEQGKLSEATASYHNAISCKPDYAEAYYNLGIMLKEQGKTDAAIASYHKAIMHDPDWADARCNLGNALQEQGKLDEAIASYRRALELDPGNESAEHLIASLTEETTERAPNRYVEKLFDGYADKFDTHLVNNLKYKTPAELLGLIKQVMKPPAGEWNVLDLGCGTGLAGVEISPHARQLTGVDLSEKMLAKARVRNIYHRLVHSDLLPMMRGENASSYDVIIAADVFVYLGMLDEIVSEARRLLHTGGYFIFSVEALEALPAKADGIEDHAGYKLRQSGRYAHSSTYLKKLASLNCFESLNLIYTQVRLEEGKPVMAWLVLWKNSENT